MDFEKLFGPNLLTKEGVKPTSEVLGGKRFVGIYFSAHWCPPCRRFTPTLSEVYSMIHEENESDLEIIFVSSDRDQGSFQEYYDSMTFCALPFEAREEKDALSKLYSVSGIPTLIILDENGNTVDKDGRNTVTSSGGNVSAILSKWAR